MSFVNASFIVWLSVLIYFLISEKRHSQWVNNPENLCGPLKDMSIAEQVMKVWMKTTDFFNKTVSILFEYEPTTILIIMCQIAFISYWSAIFKMLKKFLDQ